MAGRIAAIVALACAAVVQAAGPYTSTPTNTRLWVDTVRVSSTNSKWTDIYWQDNGGPKALLICGDDTSSAGYASDSACVKVELYQVFNIGALSGNVTRNIVRLASRAHPDSTTYPGGSKWVISDSLLVKNMDTAAVYNRNTVSANRRPGGDTAYYYGDSIAAAATGYGAFWYEAFPPDASPGVVLKITGKANNRKASGGSRWIIRWYQTRGTPGVTN